MSENTSWLAGFLELALEKHWCTRIYCTTCGAQDFRAGLHLALDRALGRPSPRISAMARIRAGYSPADCEALARALAMLRPEALGERAGMASLPMVLDELDAAVDPIFMRQVIEPLLAGSWAGDMLARMQRHEIELAAERRERAVYEAASVERRAEKKRLKAEAHAARLEAKVERDREWRARNPTPAD